MKQKSNINPRKELLSLMRGFFATPLIVAMANSGVIQKINGQWKVVQIHWSIGVQGQAIEY